MTKPSQYEQLCCCAAMYGLVIGFDVSKGVPTGETLYEVHTVRRTLEHLLVIKPPRDVFLKISIKNGDIEATACSAIKQIRALI